MLARLTRWGVRILSRVAAWNLIPALLVSLGMAIFAIFSPAIELTMCYFDLGTIWQFWFYLLLLIIFFLIAFTMTYKFKVDTYLIRLALDTIEDHSSLIYLFRRVLQNRMTRGPNYVYRFLSPFMEDVFQRLRDKLNLVDKRTLSYITGIDYNEISKHITVVNKEIERARVEERAEPAVISRNIEAKRKDLTTFLRGQLDRREFRIFEERNITGRQPYIDKLARVIGHCICEPSYSTAIQHVSTNLRKQLRLHYAALLDVQASCLQVCESVRRELFFWDYVTQGRLGYPVYRYIKQASGAGLDEILPFTEDRRTYLDRLERCTAALSKFIQRLESADKNFGISPSDWPSDADIIVIYGVSTCVQRTLE